MKACGDLVWRPTATFALRPAAVEAGKELSTLLITPSEFELTEKGARGTQFSLLCGPIKKPSQSSRLRYFVTRTHDLHPQITRPKLLEQSGSLETLNPDIEWGKRCLSHTESVILVLIPNVSLTYLERMWSAKWAP
jgi:hypothetical protein